jgi:hypothetical protein
LLLTLGRLLKPFEIPPPRCSHDGLSTLGHTTQDISDFTRELWAAAGEYPLDATSSPIGGGDEEEGGSAGDGGRAYVGGGGVTDKVEGGEEEEQELIFFREDGELLGEDVTPSFLRSLDDCSLEPSVCSSPPVCLSVSHSLRFHTPSHQVSYTYPSLRYVDVPIWLSSLSMSVPHTTPLGRHALPPMRHALPRACLIMCRHTWAPLSS